MTNKESKVLLEKWKNRLRLQDWTIKLHINLAPDDMSLDGCVGCTDWSEVNKTARIEILDEKYYGDRLVPYNFEETLVHELLHLKFTFWCQSTDEVEDRYMHTIIEDLARALTE